MDTSVLTACQTRVRSQGSRLRLSDAMPRVRARARDRESWAFATTAWAGSMSSARSAGSGSSVRARPPGALRGSRLAPNAAVLWKRSHAPDANYGIGHGVRMNRPSDNADPRRLEPFAVTPDVLAQQDAPSTPSSPLGPGLRSRLLRSPVCCQRISSGGTGASPEVSGSDWDWNPTRADSSGTIGSSCPRSDQAVALPPAVAREENELSSSSATTRSRHDEGQNRASESNDPWVGGLSGPAYAINDETAIEVVDGNVDVVSKGHRNSSRPRTETCASVAL
jgi:hypothetical protein